MYISVFVCGVWCVYLYKYFAPRTINFLLREKPKAVTSLTRGVVSEAFVAVVVACAAPISPYSPFYCNRTHIFFSCRRSCGKSFGFSSVPMFFTIVCEIYSYLFIRQRYALANNIETVNREPLSYKYDYITYSLV